MEIKIFNLKRLVNCLIIIILVINIIFINQVSGYCNSKINSFSKLTMKKIPIPKYCSLSFSSLGDKIAYIYNNNQSIKILCTKTGKIENIINVKDILKDIVDNPIIVYNPIFSQNKDILYFVEDNLNRSDGKLIIMINNKVKTILPENRDYYVIKPYDELLTKVNSNNELCFVNSADQGKTLFIEDNSTTILFNEINDYCFSLDNRNILIMDNNKIYKIEVNNAKKINLLKSNYNLDILRSNEDCSSFSYIASKKIENETKKALFINKQRISNWFNRVGQNYFIDWNKKNAYYFASDGKSFSLYKDNIKISNDFKDYFSTDCEGFDFDALNDSRILKILSSNNILYYVNTFQSANLLFYINDKLLNPQEHFNSFNQFEYFPIYSENENLIRFCYREDIYIVCIEINL